MRNDDINYSMCSTPQINRDNLNRKMPGQNSTSSHGSSASSNSAFSISNTSVPESRTMKPVPKVYIVRVGLDDNCQKGTEGTNYKCIKIEDGDKMPVLVQRAMEKHMMEEENPDDFCLVQLLPDGGEYY